MFQQAVNYASTTTCTYTHVVLFGVGLTTFLFQKTFSDPMVTTFHQSIWVKFSFRAQRQQPRLVLSVILCWGRSSISKKTTFDTMSANICLIILFGSMQKCGWEIFIIHPFLKFLASEYHDFPWPENIRKRKRYFLYIELWFRGLGWGLGVRYWIWSIESLS